jgi:hypothetical protein
MRGTVMNHRRPDVVREALHDERGMILPLVLVFLLILASLTASLLMAGSSEVTIATNLRQGIQAQYLAEAGLQDAFNLFRATPALVSGAPADLTAVQGLAGPGTALAAVGGYTVRYQRVGTNTIRLVATGTSAGGDARQTLGAVLTNSFTPRNAILVEDNLVISGNPTINGGPGCGNIHANGDLTMSGNPTVTGSATASGNYTVSGNPNLGPGSGGHTATQPVPPIVPADFLAAAQQTLPANQVYEMRASGQVLDGSGTVLTTLSSGQQYRNWTFSSGNPANWALSGNTGSNGVYYFEGNASISGNPGTSGSPWQTTLIATRNITVSGNPQMQALLPDTLLVAGNNITISGNPSLGFNGLIAAQNAISISGNATFNGFIMAGNATSLTDSVSGNPTITANCNLVTPLIGKLSTLTWGR